MQLDQESQHHGTVQKIPSAINLPRPIAPVSVPPPAGTTGQRSTQGTRFASPPDPREKIEVSFEIFNSNDMVKVFIDNINPKLSFFLKNLLYSHRNRYDISVVPVEEEGVKLQFICAIFRLIDALELYSSKCPSIVYKETPMRLCLMLNS